MASIRGDAEGDNVSSLFSIDLVNYHGLAAMGKPKWSRLVYAVNSGEVSNAGEGS